MEPVELLVAGANVDATQLASVSSLGHPPRVVTRHYMQAALYAFYLRDHPHVSTADKYVGRRSTTFDQWDDTRLDNPGLYGRSLLLVQIQGNVPRTRAKVLARVAVPWEQALVFDDVKPVDGGRFLLARNYQGPRARTASNPNEGAAEDEN